MRVHFLFAIVTVQILVFQFLSLRFLKVIPDYVLGDSGRPAEVEEAVASYRRGLGAWNYPIGLGLWVAMTLCAYVLPFTEGLPGLAAITATSLLSSGVFAWTYFRAKGAVEDMAEMLPDTGTRVASLRPRSLGRYYNVAWELVPFALLAVTVGLTLWAITKSNQPYPLGFDAQGIPSEWGQGMGRFLTVLAAQAASTFALLALTYWSLNRRPDLSPRVSVAAKDPAVAERLVEGLRRRKLRFFMVVKIAVAVQFTLMALVRTMTAAGHDLPRWLEESPWAATIFLLAVFVVFITRFGLAGGSAGRDRAMERR